MSTIKKMLNYIDISKNVLDRKISFNLKMVPHNDLFILTTAVS